MYKEIIHYTGSQHREQTIGMKNPSAQDNKSKL